ncbi:MAG: FAD-dependent monooxygenase, partial [Xanthobacteraceae bacterium]
MTRTNIDVLIAGGGFAGLTLAIALRQGLGPSFSVAVADPGFGSNQLGKKSVEDERASAIVAAARRLFETIGVWEAVAADAQPILDMVVTDSKLGDAVRPTFLTFAGDVEPGEPFAHMIENRLLVDALAAKAREVGVALQPSAVATFARDDDRVTAALVDGSELRARLLVAADGARSTIRIAAGIVTHGWTYGQSAIVINVAHERNHEGRAEEHFLPAGPFAILPLKGRRSSIVWTETTAEAARIMALSDDAFHAELEQRFKLHLGEIKVTGARRVHPLGFFVARAFVAGRIALVG